MTTPRYVLTLEALPRDGDAPPDVRLRRALKKLKREFALECIDAREQPSGPPLDGLMAVIAAAAKARAAQRHYARRGDNQAERQDLERRLDALLAEALRGPDPLPLPRKEDGP